jgi:cation:H+ antiporter
MTLWSWLAMFFVSAGALIVAGVSLARSGDEIATRTGAGGLLVGGILVAGATSFPEVATDVTAAIEGAPALAIGDLFGSSMANMAILAVIDLVGRRQVLPAVELAHAQIGSLAMALTALAVIGVATPVGFAIGWIGIDTVVIVGAYVAAVAWVRRSRARRPDAVAEEAIVPTGWGIRGVGGSGLRRAFLRFAFAAVAVLVSAPLVAISSQGIARETGIGETFVGTTLVAMATSLPELVASLAAVRIGAFDLAVGNLFGSNALNMATLAVVDAAYVEGPLLSAVSSPSVVVAGVGALLLMALAIALIVGGTETRIKRLEPDAVLLLAAYVGCIAAIWSVST